MYIVTVINPHLGNIEMYAELLYTKAFNSLDEACKSLISTLKNKILPDLSYEDLANTEEEFAELVELKNKMMLVEFDISLDYYLEEFMTHFIKYTKTWDDRGANECLGITWYITDDTRGEIVDKIDNYCTADE